MSRFGRGLILTPAVSCGMLPPHQMARYLEDDWLSQQLYPVVFGPAPETSRWMVRLIFTAAVPWKICPPLSFPNSYGTYSQRDLFSQIVHPLVFDPRLSQYQGRWMVEGCEGTNLHLLHCLVRFVPSDQILTATEAIVIVVAPSKHTEGENWFPQILHYVG